MASRVLVTSDSTMIERITWDHDSRAMEVTFRTRKTYRYERVFPSDFAALACAHSVGKCFNERIRTRYVGRELGTTDHRSQNRGSTTRE